MEGLNIAWIEEAKFLIPMRGSEPNVRPMRR